MDHRPIVGQAAASAATARVEQAIFTSIRSPMARGYRIVAASAGISADEKKEITQCAPSHGSLCDPSPSGAGLASYALRSRRHCIFISRNADIEQTARGGYRVHTHVLVMDQAVFRRFQLDPLRVEAALPSTVGAAPMRSPPARLDPLLLPLETDERTGWKYGATPPPAISSADRVTSILSAVLGERRVLVVGAPTPREILRCLLGATPAAVRQRLSVSYGLRFSPARKWQLVFAGADRGETERTIRGQDIDLFDWESAPAEKGSPFDAWLRFVRQRWRSERYDDIDHLSAQLMQESSAQALEQIATLSADIERLKEADAALLDQLAHKHARITPAGPAHARLLGGFQKAAEKRRACLACPGQEPAAGEDTPLKVHP